MTVLRPGTPKGAMIKRTGPEILVVSKPVRVNVQFERTFREA